LLIASPRALAEVLTTNNYDFKKPPQVLRFVERLIGVGQVFAEGEEHKTQRKT
jgi:hypothetical protein